MPPAGAQISATYGRAASPPLDQTVHRRCAIEARALSRIFVTRGIAEPALQKLRERHQVDVWPGPGPVPRDVLLAAAHDSDALLSLLTEKVDAELLATAPKLRVVSNMAVGYDNIDVAACTARKIPVGHTPGVLTQATADLTFALLLAAARRIAEAERYVRNGEWRTWDPSLLLGRELEGTTLGIAGFGGIGQAVATRAKGFGMRILYCSRSEVKFEGAIRVEKPTLLAQSDFVSIHLPLSIATRHWLTRHDFAQMKSGSILINAARGPIIDQPALLDALDLGRPAFAALDVTDPEPPPADDPLLKHPKLLVVPHLGSATLETRTKMAVLAAENLLAVLDGRKPKHVVNPEVLS